MRLLQKIELPSSAPWEPGYSGKFYVDRGIVRFYYMYHNDICVVDSDGECLIIPINSSESNLPLPDRWLILGDKNGDYLFCSDHIAIDLKNNIQLPCIDNGLMNHYHAEWRDPMHFVQDSFLFENYELSHKGDFGYQCKRNGKLLWTFAGRGYLYSDVYRYHNLIYWCTAGYGGHFYVLSIEDGSIMLDIDTGGTASVECEGSLVYILSRKPKSEVLCIDLSSVSIIARLPIEGKVSDYSVMKLFDNKIYAVSFQYKRGALNNAILNCIAIE